MNDRKIVWVAIAAYFLLAPLAAGPLAVYIAEIVVEARDVSNFEGARGYAVVLSTPFYWVILTFVFLLAYLLVRRSRAALYFVTFCFAMLSVPTFEFLASLL
ncbi:MAG: hypothetical protein IV085_04370 [Thiobacillus sp.]|nr:hypothetical protein [Thiobacillus sp.]